MPSRAGKARSLILVGWAESAIKTLLSFGANDSDFVAELRKLQNFISKR